MSEELRRKDDARYHEMRDIIGVLEQTIKRLGGKIDEMNLEISKIGQQQESIIAPSIESLKSEIQESRTLFYNKDGVFQSLNEHTVKINDIVTKLASIDSKLASIDSDKSSKKEKLPGNIKVEKLPRLIGMVIGGIIVGIGGAIWAVMEILKFIKQP